MVFKSAVGTYFYLTMLVVVAVLTFVGWVLLKKSGVAGLVPLVVGGAPALGIPLWLLCSTYYEVTADKLLINAAWMHVEIPRADIKSITPSNSVLSSPALSLDRLDIRYGYGNSVHVSPKDKAGFIAALGMQ